MTHASEASSARTFSVGHNLESDEQSNSQEPRLSASVALSTSAVDLSFNSARLHPLIAFIPTNGFSDLNSKIR